MKRTILINIFTFTAIVILFTACQSKDNFTGREYMPDMAHSIAYEANQNTFYEFNHWGKKDDYNNFVQPRLPQTGTVAYGRSKIVDSLANRLTYPRYAFENTEEERTKATEMITSNALKPNSIAELENHLSHGKELYEIYCSSCHGKAGDGNGKLHESGVYLAKPANFMSDDLIKSNDGRYYHAIMYGKNVMLSHADKLSHDERWKVIHYIRSLQAAKAGVEYDLNAAKGVKSIKPEEKKEDKKDEKKEEKKGK
jgi:mono/diheme cytochrome c family protein